MSDNLPDTDPEELDTVQIMKQVHRIRHENRALFARLVEGEKRFRGLAKAVWMVQEDERRRLARELHDGIGQTLTALKNQLERQRLASAGSDLANGLADSVELASSALNDTRELSRLLRPAVLDDLGLSAALSWLSRTLGKRASITINVDCTLGEKRHPEDVETLVYRVVQEALTNVIKHAQVSTVDVAVAEAGDWLRITVRDEGAGFDPQQVVRRTDGNAGVGLRGMRDRLELFGGRLAIDASPGRGCKLEMAVPLLRATDTTDGEN